MLHEVRLAMRRVLGYGVWFLAAAVILGGARPAFGLSMGGGARGPVGYLGINVKGVGDDQVASLRLKDAHGAEIVTVDHDGPAGKCGLREHDVVLVMNGQAVENEEQMRRMLHDLPPGRTVSLVISREGQTLNINTQMADRETVERQAWEQHLTVPEPAYVGPSDPAPADAGYSVSTGAPVRGGKGFLGSMLLLSPSYTGAVLEVMGPQLAGFFGVESGTGLLVRSVAGNSPAALAGMRAGDVVVRANAQKLKTTSEWMKAIRESKGRPVSVVVMRDKKEVTLTITPDVKHRSSIDTLEREWNSHGLPALWAKL